MLFFSAERDLFPLPSHSEGKQPACGSPCSGGVSFPCTAAHIWCPSPRWNTAPQRYTSTSSVFCEQEPLLLTSSLKLFLHLTPTRTLISVRCQQSTQFTDLPQTLKKLVYLHIVARWWSWTWEIIQHQASTGNHCTGVGTFEHQNLGQYPCSYTSWTGRQGLIPPVSWEQIFDSAKVIPLELLTEPVKAAKPKNHFQGKCNIWFKSNTQVANRIEMSTN